MILFQTISLQNIQSLGLGSKKNIINKDSVNISTDKFFQVFLQKKVNAYPVKRVLIVVGKCTDSIMTAAAGNELCNLLGHFNTSVNIIHNKDYKSKTIRKYDVLFYVGLQSNDSPSKVFLNDIYKWNKTIVWMNSGFSAFNNQKKEKWKFGFTVGNIDQSRSFNIVKSGSRLFNRKDNDIFSVQIINCKSSEIIATAINNISGNTLPYIVKSKKLYYIADIPYFNCSVTDRYLLFADVLHDIMGENHQEKHKAIVRIEDVTPIRNPERLRKIADILSERNIPFLIGVIPFYVNPVKNARISLSDKPEMVAALKYCISKGGTIIMHGITHQYKGVSAVDFEYWDGSTNKPIVQSETEIKDKIEDGLNECAKNEIYPLYWETPHYVASSIDYKIFSQFFSSSVERLMIANSFTYGQFFPYVIQRDFYGEKVFPEDLGYMPLIYNKDSSELYVESMITNAKGLLNVRDGYASFFFHTFVNLDYLAEIADGISNLGYKFVDLQKETNWVKSPDLIILSGSQKYTLTLNNQSLTEIYYNNTGQEEKRIVSNPNVKKITKNIVLMPDEFYVAETSLNKSKKSISDISMNHNGKQNNTIFTHDKN